MAVVAYLYSSMLANSHVLQLLLFDSSRLETLLLTYCQLVPSLGRTHSHSGRYGCKGLLGSERQEHVLGHAAAVAMDTKWLLGRAGESVVAVSRGQIRAVSSDIHCTPTYGPDACTQ